METANKILEKLSTIRDLPTLPMVAQKLNEVVYDPTADAKKMAAIIEDDPAIMAKILKVVNSALYAGTEEVTSVQHAVSRMGTMTVSNIAMSTSVFSSFEKQDDEAFNREEFWRHSICCGIALGVLAERCRSALPFAYRKDMLHLAGLVHDLGKVLLDQYFPEEFHAALAMSKEKEIPLHEAEFEIMGTSHGMVGAWLGTQWKLSPQLVQVMRQHHNPNFDDEDFWSIAALCNVGNDICNMEGLGTGGDLEKPKLCDQAWSKLGLNIDDTSEIMEEIHEESKNSEVLMSFV
ncbi:hypothetical protein BVX97_01620 [bacterium E08(2017)]|nr:hypothetical protein BVX97_01620 [bacterium E08(2017)]